MSSITRRNLLGIPLGLLVSDWVFASGHFVGSDVSASCSPGDRRAILRRLKMNLIFRNPYNHLLNDQRFFCYLPKVHGETQTLLKTDVGYEHQVHHDYLGHRILCIEFDNFQPFAQAHIDVSVEVCSNPFSTPVFLIDSREWLNQERYIESEHKSIQNLGLVLRRASIWDTARSIYDWVRTSIEYAGYVAEDLGALYALRERRGDCTEYANLVVALARSNGIPARMIGGYVVQNSAVLKAYDYHNWAELFLDGEWHIVDAQKENWLPSTLNYVAFRVYRDAVINEVGQAHRYRMSGELVVQL